MGSELPLEEKVEATAGEKRKGTKEVGIPRWEEEDLNQ